MKNKKALILLLFANVISGMAQGISMISIPWYFAREGYLDIFIWFYIATNVIGIFWVPYSGTLVDKYNRKKVFLVLNLASGLLLGLVCIYGFIHEGLPLLAVAGVFIMTFLNYSIHYPAIYAFVQEITPKRLYGKITSILEIQGQATNIIAGAAAVLLLEGNRQGKANIFGFKIDFLGDFEAWGIHEIFFLDCMTYFLSFLVIASIRYIPLIQREEEVASLKERLSIGLRFLKENKVTFLFGVVSYTVFVAVLLEGFYLGAAYVKNQLGSGGDVYASSDIMYSLGALVSGFFIRKVLSKINIPTSIIVMTLMTAALFMTLALNKSDLIFYIMLFFLGLTNAGTRILRVTYLFNNIPNQVFGRAASIFNICNILLRIVLLLIFALPFFQAGNHVIYSFMILTAVLIAAAIIMMKYYKKFDLKIY